MSFFSFQLFRNQRVTPFTDPTARFEAGRFGMWLLIATLAVIFASTLMAYVFVRLSPNNIGNWPPPHMPPLPQALLLSTIFLIASSGTMHVATLAARRGEPGVGVWMVATLCLGCAFLGVQTYAWIDAMRDNMAFTKHLYAWTFYVLTVLHALHVIGGLLPMLVTTRNAVRGLYGPERLAGITYCGMYWHFLDAAWIVLYATLLWGSTR
ncbi:MAG: cytochrome c oxidase subunit 3 [Phycisphaerae bacterium]|jgi:cytochrome c oxidase subunit 3|nr:cytochrome c oxidase subunit 3 [Phycisphaerae bacterium]